MLQSGVLGVSLAGSASVASVMLGGHVFWVHLGSLLEGHRVTAIALSGITLDNGVHIARGTGSVESAPAPIVPPIEAGPETSAPVTPPPASGISVSATAGKNTLHYTAGVGRRLPTPTPFMPHSFPTPAEMEPPL